MPKDAKKNVDRYKIRGGDLNEFEFTKNQAQVKEAAEPRKGVPAAKKSAKPIKGATARKLAEKKKK
jgi:hypothetical protein